jgi:hypothetical protein
VDAEVLQQDRRRVLGQQGDEPDDDAGGDRDRGALVDPPGPPPHPIRRARRRLHAVAGLQRLQPHLDARVPVVGSERSKARDHGGQARAANTPGGSEQVHRVHKMEPRGGHGDVYAG